MGKILLLFFLCIHGAVLAQTGNTGSNNVPQQTIYAVLPDSGYSFRQILSGSNLSFITGDSLQPAKHGFYWLKVVIANPGHFTGQYAITATPQLLNTYYYFDANSRQWLSQTAGISTNDNNGYTKEQAMYVQMPPGDTNVVYIKMEVQQLQKFARAIKPSVYIRSQLAVNRQQQVLYSGWLVAVSVLCFFFLSNLYVYFTFRDRPVLFYLVVQVGAFIYITAYRRLFSVNVFTLGLTPGGEIRHYGLNNLLMHAGIVLTMLGFVQLCRSYLNTKKYMPLADAVLYYSIIVYTALSVILMVVNVAFLYVERYTLVYDNIYLLLLIIVIAATCVVGYRRRLRAAGAFLIAMGAPLVMMVCIPVFFLFISVNGDLNLYIPNLAVVSDSVLFSVALVARIKLIQNDLRLKELEAQQLNFHLLEAELKRNVVELENQKINSDIQAEKSKYGLLQLKLEANQRQLASTAVHMINKNQLLTRLKAKIADLKKLNADGNPKEFAEIEAILKSGLRVDEDWRRFKLHFENVHPHFFKNLQESHPLLTKTEIRLYAYFHIHLSTKEIAILLNIAPASVRQAKMRLYKKMGQPAPLENAGEDDLAGEEENMDF